MRLTTKKSPSKKPVAKKSTTRSSKALRNNTVITSRDTKGRIKAAHIKNPKRPAMSRRNDRAGWDAATVKELKSLAKQNTPTRVIGLKLGRTVASVRAKARQANISLKPANRSPNKPKSKRA